MYLYYISSEDHTALRPQRRIALKRCATFAALAALILAPHHAGADVCEQSDDTGGIGLTLKIPAAYEKTMNHALSVVLSAGLEGNLTAFTSDYDATNAGFFAHLEFRAYPRPRYRQGWLGLFVAQKMLYTNNGTKSEPDNYMRSVTSVGFIMGHKIWRNSPGSTGVGGRGMADIFIEIEMATYRNVSRNCSHEIEDEYSMVWLYFGVTFGIANM